MTRVTHDLYLEVKRSKIKVPRPSKFEILAPVTANVANTNKNDYCPLRRLIILHRNMSHKIIRYNIRTHLCYIYI